MADDKTFDYLAQLVDTTGTEINPATEDKQDEIIAGVEAATDLEGLGDITVGLTEVAITIAGTPTKSIRIQADDSNNGIIYIGKTGVLADGSNDFIRLKRGDEMKIKYNDSTNPLYAISDTAAQKINVGAAL
jgi:hypothetical protein